MPFFHIFARLALAASPVFTLVWPMPATAMDLKLDSTSVCAPLATTPPPQTPLPAQASQRLPNSQSVAGQRQIAWVWLGSPTASYPHPVFGSPHHAGSIHAQVRHPGTQAWHIVALTLPAHRVFEDLVPRLIDLDGDGQDEIVVIESDAQQGSALLVLAVAHNAQGEAQLVQSAIGPRTGTPFRWLNPVGVADFDGDGRLDIASVSTPHIGGNLTLLRYQPPHLVPFANIADVSNHHMGSLEQRLAVILEQPGLRPTILLPDRPRRALRALRWEAPGRWQEPTDRLPLSQPVEQLSVRADATVCALLSGGRELSVTLAP